MSNAGTNIGPLPAPGRPIAATSMGVAGMIFQSASFGVLSGITNRYSRCPLYSFPFTKRGNIARIKEFCESIADMHVV